MKPVSSVDEATKAIEVFSSALKTEPGLSSRLGQAHAFYVLDETADEPMFGFSKFVGYADLTPERYVRDYKALDGRNTEHALAPWFEEVRDGSPMYRQLFAKLESLLSEFGKRPRQGASQKVRFMILKPEFREESLSRDDRSLLNLLIAVADMLPIEQRHELRAAL